MTTLRIASKEDINQISKLAKIIWNEHYISIIGLDQVNYMLDKMYNEESLLNQITTLDHQFFLIEKDHDHVGFISVSSNDSQNFMIHKFYILQKKSNAGIGTEALNCLTDIIHPKSLILNVNRKNYKSINFYFKNGFKISGVKDIDIGNGYEMNDFEMLKVN